ncbi:ATP-binding cassette domain-containing protein [Flammeovirga yaeyamensis]|uniref:ATP-binding cassette domain-containing protein n=1 Tax=Flammeovirga yaeyamensis TaxID=367791 RepID=A0AAX1N9P5_9BACT|nr:ABC transporter ATP-binding protein [Flammeovirga yaeyamensis]NMF36960.1 ABC transporter ATP-binding protein [Flammeovirga yaeyamensis]QWG03932.1 ATP-binding cassette domain-containing protein [Flammeovirga yaeyamensis]
MLVFVKPHMKEFVFLVFLTIGLGVLAPSRPYLIQYTIDNFIIENDMPGLNQMIVILIAVQLLQALVQFCHTYLSGWLGQHIVKDMRVQLYEHILKLKLKFYDNTPIGRLVTRAVSDIETLSEVFTNGVAAMLGDILQLIFIFLVMLYTDWRLTLISLSVLPLLLFSTYVFKEKIKVAFNEVRNAVSNLNTFVQEHITGMNVVQLFSAEQREQEEFQKINKEHRNANISTVLYYSIYYPVAEVIAASGTGLLVWWGAHSVLDGYATLGTLIAFIMYINLFFRPIRMIADRFNTLQMGIVSSDRILKLLDDKDFISNEGNYTTDHINGDVEFKDVWFAYNDEDYVLKNINFKVNHGETVALVGATGAGKSSIINLISRFYEINKGSIYVNQKEVKEYDLHNLRKHVGVVLQDVFLFSSSIRDNITLGDKTITDKQIMKAAELVGAKSFIEKLPGQLDYKVMERGATLSVGQRQLLSFVRTMVYDPAIIILDEATSSVDSETEALIQNAINSMMKGRTSIAIAHRLATIRNADNIIVLDKGEIKESGSHDKLLEKNGFYAKLYQMQYKEVEGIN